MSTGWLRLKPEEVPVNGSVINVSGCFALLKVLIILSFNDFCYQKLPSEK